MSVFPPIAPFSFSAPPGNALHKNKPVQNCISCRKRKTKCDRLQPCTPCKNRGEASTCEPHVKEAVDRPTGYTHVSDTSILANRVAQLELVLSRLLQQQGLVEAYKDVLLDFKDPLPVYRPGAKDGSESRDQDERDGCSTAPLGKRQRSMSEAMPDDSALLSLSAVDAQAMRFTGRSSPSLGSSGFLSKAQLESSIRTKPLFQQTTIADVETGPSKPASSGQEPFPELAFPATGAEDVGNHTWLNMHPGHLSFLSESAIQYNQAAQNGHEYIEPPSKAPSEPELDASLALEGMALGREYTMGKAMSDIESDPQGLFATNSPATKATFTSFIQRKRPLNPTPVVKEIPSAAMLPSLIVGNYVLSYFLDEVDFMWRCLHRPTFEAQHKELRVLLRSRSNGFTLDQLSTLALYCACLAVGFHFLQDDAYTDLNLDESEAADLAASCWKVCLDALEASDWMQVSNIKSCQTIIIIGLYLSSIRRASQHWTLCGVATKIALALGLSSVPSEEEFRVATLRERVSTKWQSAIDREVGRRVWFCLLELDWLFSIEHNFQYIISPEIHRTGEPANVNDTDLHEDQVVVSHPSSVHTDMSYFLQRIRILYPLQGVVRNVRRAGRMRYEFVSQAQTEMQQAVNERPLFYTNPDAFETAMSPIELGRIRMEARSLDEATALRTLRIHRYYFPASCKNPRYALTKKTCLDSARRILAQTDSNGLQPENQHYWALAYCMFTATVAIVLYLHHAQENELDEFKSLVLRGIERLRVLSQKGRTDLGDTAETLNALMLVQLERRRPADTTDVGPSQTFPDLPMNWDTWSGPSLEQLAALPSSGLGSMTNLLGTGDQDLSALLDSWLVDVSGSVI